MFVSNETKVLATGLPSRSISAVNAEFIVEPAAIVEGVAEIDSDPDLMTIDVD